MITNKGKDIIAKYMIGQAPSYASYIAIGCGASPIDYTSDNVVSKTVISQSEDANGRVLVRINVASPVNSYSAGDKIVVKNVDNFYDGIYTVLAVPSGMDDGIYYRRTASASGNYETIIATVPPVVIGTVNKAVTLNQTYMNKQNLDFEMLRVPIISRGYVTDNNLSQVVFTAELPTEERYEITEVGVYSAGSNPSASNNDSRTLFSFAQSEQWQYHSTTTSQIEYVPQSLDLEGTPGIINQTKFPAKAYQVNADNTALITSARVLNKETTRFLNNAVLVRGDASGLTLTGNAIDPGSNKTLSGNHIHLAGANLNLNTNALTDEIRLAYSVIHKDAAYAAPSKVAIAIEFAHGEDASSENARFESVVDGNFSNRYSVITKKLKDIKTTSGFLWTSVQVVRIFITVIPAAGRLSSEYYVALDAIRLENTTTTNPLYGMTGYSVIRNSNGSSIVKNPNTSNLIEFRFGMGIE